MTPKESILNHATLVESLDYDPRTGVFKWKVRSSDKIRIGDVAGSPRDGYRIIRLNGTYYRAHRLAWFYVYKKWPQADIDHINLVRDDNRIENMREATRSQNLRNRNVSGRNVSGLKGVSRNGNQFMARLTKSPGVHLYLGTFDTPEEAHEAYVTASYEHHGEYGRAS